MPNEGRKRAGRSGARATFAVSAVALALALSACGKPAAHSARSTEHPVLVVTAHFAPTVAPRNLVGVVKARVESNLGFRVTGKIAQQDQQLSDLDVEFDRIAQMMAAEDLAFRRDIANGGSLLEVTAAHEETLKAELVYADRALGALAAGLKGHERDLNAMLKAMPGVLDELRALSDHSSTALAILDPCMGDVVQTIAEMANATSYRDANGNMLRVHPYAGNEAVDPTRLACGGGG